MDNISVNSKRFVDEYNRERIFHGVNFGAKNFPFFEWYENEGNFGVPFEKCIESLHRHGVNVIRHFVNWSCIEPQPNQYDENVLRGIQRFLDTCERHDIYVYLDMHQDLFSLFKNPYEVKNFNGMGDGAPLWACITDGEKFTKGKFVWAEGYFFSKAVQNAFDNFWDNTEVEGKGLQDHFCDMWKMLAKRFGNHPALLGFDILNEPYPGSDGGKVFSLIAKNAVKTTFDNKKISKKKLFGSITHKKPIKKILDQYHSGIIDGITEPAYEIIERFDKEKYAPFISRVTAAIREVTDKGIIFQENCYYSNLGIPFSAPAITVNGEREKNQAFAPHAYDLMVDTPLYKYADNERVTAIFNKRRQEQLELDVPVIVGEWGAGVEVSDWHEHGNKMLDLFDQYKWSSTYWAFIREAIDTPVIDMIHRPYPMAVCGEIEGICYNKEMQTFELKFEQDKDYPVPTEIYLHREPKEIKTSGRYIIEKLGKKGAIMKLFTDKGEHTVSITF